MDVSEMESNTGCFETEVCACIRQLLAYSYKLGILRRELRASEENYILHREDIRLCITPARSGIAPMERDSPISTPISVLPYHRTISRGLMESLCTILLASTFLPDTLRSDIGIFGKCEPPEKRTQP